MAEITKEDVGTFLSTMNVMELVALTKELEEKWGVKAEPAAPTAVVTGAGMGLEPPGTEQTEFTVTLTDAGATKINVIKAVREMTGLGLKEAKDAVDGAPKVLKEGISKADAHILVQKIVEAGGKAEMK